MRLFDAKLKKKINSVSTVSLSVPPSSSSSLSLSPPSENASTSKTSVSLRESGYYSKQLPTEVYRATKPMLYILRSQLSRRYSEWSETGVNASSSGLQDQTPHTKWWLCLCHKGTKNSNSTRTIPVRRLSLVGITLNIETRDGNLEKYSLIDPESGLSNIKLHSDSIELPLTQGPQTLQLLQCNEPKRLLSLQLLTTISIFEHFSCYKSITGMLISSLGLRLPDIHLLLRSQFNYKDWCEIYLEGEGWVRAWCHVNRDSKLRSTAKSNRANGKYQIKFYRSDKFNASASASNGLICCIWDSCRIEDIVFYNGAYTDTSTGNLDVDGDEMMVVSSFLDGLKCIKVIGDVLYPLDTRTSSEGKAKALKTSSSGWSFSSFSSSSSRTKRKGLVSTIEQGHGHGSGSRPGLVKRNSGLLIKPIPHGGVSSLESLIRLVVPMLDVTRKYGRPEHFKASRTDSKSLMFGLPKLPEVNFLSDEQIRGLLNVPQVKPGADIGDVSSFSMLSGSKYLESCL